MIQSTQSIETAGVAPPDRRPAVTRLAATLRDALSSSHLPCPAAEALCTPLALLLGRHLRIDAADSHWPDRDRVVLFADAAPLGPASSTLLGAPPGLFHASPEALGSAAGLALAERMLAGRFGRSLVDHRCWVLGGGTMLATGAVQEAAWLAGAWRLGRLTMVTSVEDGDCPGLAGFTAHGWIVRRAAADEPEEIAAALSAALRSSKPTLVACTGPPPFMTGLQAAEPAAWDAAGRRAAGMRRSWLRRLSRHFSRTEFAQAAAGRLPPRWHEALSQTEWLGVPGQSTLSTVHAVRRALDGLAAGLPELATLPGKPGWPPGAAQPEPPVATRSCSATLSRATASALSGMALHGGLLPLATFCLDEFENIWPVLGCSARAGLRGVAVLVEPGTAGISDGRLAAMRATPNLEMFRPADASEALECLELALRRTAGPSVLLLSDVPARLLSPRLTRTRAARGAYLVAAATGPRAATLIAGGPELGLAWEVRDRLTAAGIEAAIVSLPCWDLAAAQDPDALDSLLGAAPRIGIERSSGFGWAQWLGQDGLFVGLGDASPAAAIQTIEAAILRHLNGRSHRHA